MIANRAGGSSFTAGEASEANRFLLHPHRDLDPGCHLALWLCNSLRVRWHGRHSSDGGKVAETRNVRTCRKQSGALLPIRSEVVSWVHRLLLVPTSNQKVWARVGQHNHELRTHRVWRWLLPLWLPAGVGPRSLDGRHQRLAVLPVWRRLGRQASDDTGGP